MPPTRKNRLSQSKEAKYHREYRAKASEENRKKWAAERAERKRKQCAREKEHGLERKKEQEDREKREKKARHAAAQARYLAKKKQATIDNIANQPQTPNSKAEQIALLIEKSTPTTTEILSAKGIEKQRQRTADKKIVGATATVVKDAAMRKSLFPHLRGSNTKAISETLNISRTHFYYKSKKGENPRLPKTVIDTVLQFYHGSDAVTTCPFKTRNGKVLRIMKFTKQRAYRMFCEQNENLKLSQSTFNRLRPRYIKLMKHNQWVQCACDICENLSSLLRGMISSMKRSHFDIPDVLLHKSALAAATVCSLNNEQCLFRKCKKCKPEQLLSHLDEWLSDDDGGKVLYNKWAFGKDTENQTSKHMRRRDLSVSRAEAYQDLIGMLAKFPNHLTNAKAQSSSFKLCKAGLNEDEVVVIVDFAENYKCRQAVEAQSGYFCRNSVTIHPMVMIFKKGLPVVRDSVVAVSGDLHHDAHSVKTYLQVLESHIQIHYPMIKRVIIWSDGCSAQYKSRRPMHNLAHAFGTSLNFTWNFFGSRHGKCEADGEAAVVKNYLERVIKAEHASVNDMMDVFTILNTSDRNIVSGPSQRHFYLVQVALIQKERDIAQEKICAFPQIRSLHQIDYVSPGIVNYRRHSCYCDQPCTHQQTISQFKYPDPLISNRSVDEEDDALSDEEGVSSKDDASEWEWEDEVDTFNDSELGNAGGIIDMENEPSSEEDGDAEANENDAVISVQRFVRENPDLFDDELPDDFDAWEAFDLDTDEEFGC